MNLQKLLVKAGCGARPRTPCTTDSPSGPKTGAWARAHSRTTKAADGGLELTEG